jgi:hypothetical protein
MSTTEAAPENTSQQETVCYSNGRFLKFLGYLIFVVIILADITAIGSLIIRR